MPRYIMPTLHNFYKVALLKDAFECPNCCNITKSTGVINIMAYNKEWDIPTISTSFLNDNVEILIHSKIRQKYPFIVSKTMTLGGLKEKIQKEKGINKDDFHLSFKRPLIDSSTTLEYYGINKRVTLIMISVLNDDRSGYLKEINIKFIKVQKNTNK